MKVYEGANLRNLALIGHGHAGKTTLVSAMLYTAGATPRLGRVDDGSAPTDYDEEEIARKMSISTGLAFVEWGKPEAKVKINLLDTPGFNMFVHEAKMVLPVVDAALVVVDGVSGVEVVTQRVWNYCNDIELPRMIVVNRMDRERADANRVLESLTTAFGRAVTPLQLPIGSEKSLSGVVDLVRMKAYTYEMGGNGKGKEGPIPANMADVAKEAHEKLVELVAEGKDELMEEFFETGTIPEEHLVPALHEAIREDKLFPVLFTSGLGNIGVDELMDFIVDYTPAASEHHALTGWTAEGSSRAGRTQRHRQRTRFRLRFQDHVRRIRRAHFLLQGFLRRAEERRLAAELQSQYAREVCPHFTHPGQASDSDPGTACRRYRRGREAERDSHRRHAGR